jgi:oxygen-dependent protoporphyrinogen oxidase
MFVRPRKGVAALPNALAERLGTGASTTRTAVRKAEPRGGGFAITADVGAMLARCLVLATPASATADVVADAWPEVAAQLRTLRTVSTAVVLLVYGDGTATALPDATGFVVPRERAPMTAATFLSRKWPDQRFRTRAVVRCFVGADGSEDVIDAPDDDLVEAVAAHLAAVTGLPPRPEHAAVVRWPGAMPQYEVGHLGRVDAIERSLPPGMFVVGNAYRGVGVADTVHGANETAEAIHAYLGEHDRTESVR